MELIEGMLTRASKSNLVQPGPTEEEVNIALNCAFRAPDHGRIRPWRFHLVHGEARESLGRVFLSSAELAAEAKDILLTDKQKEKFLNMPLRAPLVIVVTSIVKACKIPPIEQCLAVGAAVQHLQLAFHALGYGSIWRTGEMASSPSVKAAFDAGDQDEIIAFLYVGKINDEKAANEVKDVANISSKGYRVISEENRGFVNAWLGSP